LYHAVSSKSSAPVSTVVPAVKLRLRVVSGDEDAFGPGKAQLLESLLQTASLNRSAAEMKMSYMKALALVRAMNAHFAVPLVELSRGGRQGGGTRVTETGLKVLEAYHDMQQASEAAAKPAWRRLKRWLKE
jgi:molybdate transport system regulatory protein